MSAPNYRQRQRRAAARDRHGRSRHRPAFDLYAQECAFGGETFEQRGIALIGGAEIVGHPARLGDTEGAHGFQCQRSFHIVKRWGFGVIPPGHDTLA